jgi:hypothetical protein
MFYNIPYYCLIITRNFIGSGKSFVQISFLPLAFHSNVIPHQFHLVNPTWAISTTQHCIEHLVYMIHDQYLVISNFDKFITLYIFCCYMEITLEQIPVMIPRWILTMQCYNMRMQLSDITVLSIVDPIITSFWLWKIQLANSIHMQYTGKVFITE